MITKKIKAGSIYAIPLFLPGSGKDGDMKENTVSYSKQNFKEKGQEFAFCRIIEDLGASGILIEVFDVLGRLDTDPQIIISSGRLFSPVLVFGLGIRKKRWKLVSDKLNYDPQRDSNFSEIKIIKGISPFLLELWQNHKLTPISESEAQKYDKWRILYPTDLEEMIKNKICFTPSS